MHVTICSHVLWRCQAKPPWAIPRVLEEITRVALLEYINSKYFVDNDGRFLGLGTYEISSSISLRFGKTENKTKAF